MLFDLHILLVGLVNWIHPDVFDTANALIGGHAFIREQWKEKQHSSVETEDGSRLHVTYMPELLFAELGKAKREGRITGEDLSDYQAVAVVMRSGGSHIGVWYEDTVTDTLSRSFGESFIRKNCLVIVAGRKQFVKAQNEGKVRDSFIDWCRGRGGLDDNFKAVFHGVQERWLSLDTTGSERVLNRQREGLIDLIDGQILGAKRKIAMEKHFAQLKQQVLRKGRHQIDDIWKNMDNNKYAIKMNQIIDKQLAELKQQVLKNSTDQMKEIQRLVGTNEYSAKKLYKIEKQLVHLKKQILIETAEQIKDIRLNFTAQLLDLQEQFQFETRENIEDIRKFMEEMDCPQETFLPYMIKSTALSLLLMVVVTRLCRERRPARRRM